MVETYEINELTLSHNVLAVTASSSVSQRERGGADTYTETHTQQKTLFNSPLELGAI